MENKFITELCKIYGVGFTIPFGTDIIDLLKNCDHLKSFDGGILAFELVVAIFGFLVLFYGYNKAKENKNDK